MIRWDQLLRPGGKLGFTVWCAPPLTEGFAITLVRSQHACSACSTNALPPIVMCARAV